jgi:hypothetical protein
MAVRESPLPTAWLAPPEGLLPSNHITKFEPVPIAVSATIALIVGAVAIILFNRKGKDVFLEDYIINASENVVPAAITAHNGIRNEIPVAVAGQVNNIRNTIQDTVNLPQIQYPGPVREHYAERQPSFGYQPKLHAVLGWKDNRELDRNKAQLSPSEFRPYREPTRRQCDEYEHDRETLNDYEKNSAYLPFARSATSGNLFGSEVGERGGSDRSLLFARDSVNRRSFISLASKTRLGDAY